MSDLETMELVLHRTATIYQKEGRPIECQLLLRVVDEIVKTIEKRNKNMTSA